MSTIQNWSSNMPNTTIQTILICLLALFPLIGKAQTCQTGSLLANTPDAQFTIGNNGTVTDNKTGLMWKRCSEGQAWDGSTCTGSAAIYTWQAALQQGQPSGFAGFTDWRVPNIKELRSIVELQCVDPSVNLNIFPATPFEVFWSSSTYAESSGNAWAWVIYFDYGYGNVGIKNSGYHVRLVRSGQ